MQRTGALLGAILILATAPWGCLRPPPDFTPGQDASEDDAAQVDAGEFPDDGHGGDSGRLFDAGTDTDTVVVDADTIDVDIDADAKPQVRWASVALGDGFGCGLTIEGAAYCWGSNEFGQLGSATVSAGATSRSLTPTLVGIDSGPWKKIAVGFNHACAIDMDDHVYCWGDNRFGGVAYHLARGSVIVPQAAIGRTVSEVAAGDGHTCVIATAGGVHCWGNNDSGQVGPLDLGMVVDLTEVTAASARAITLGSAISCLADLAGVVKCWGSSVERASIYDQESECTDACSAPVVSPRIVAGGGTYGELSVGVDHICGVNDDGFAPSAQCWGNNLDPSSSLIVGKMGDNTPTKESRSPLSISGAGRAQQVSAGWAHSCAIGEVVGVRNDALWCWGSDRHGALGRDDVESEGWTYQAREVEGEWGLVSAGAYVTCGIKTDKTLWCWGRNASGELGVGDTQNRDVPTRVEFP